MGFVTLTITEGCIVLLGRYTLMVLRVRHPSIDRILVTDRLPANLHHHANPFGILKATW